MAAQPSMADQRKKLLLNLISEVKARLDGKVNALTFPIPQFVVVGKQSVGKSRLIESLAGEAFNFVSGTLGSRRPTVLEFRNVPGLNPSRWSVFDDERQVWNPYPVTEVMKLVGEAHEKLGMNVTEVPIRVKVEGAEAVDLGLVDLPGFRAYAKDPGMQELCNKIEKLVYKFMQDENNVMLCVEEAGDAAGFATLGRCKQFDPSYRRTVLIRNKLDKYYNDLTAENVNKWIQGYGDLPDTLSRFALSLPHWTGERAPKSFSEMRAECARRDLNCLISDKKMSKTYAATIGVDNFLSFMELKTQQLFSDALTPMLTRLKALRDEYDETAKQIKMESETINEQNILHATRQAGICFAQSFNFLMEGALSSETNRKTMEEELHSFHEHIGHEGTLRPDEALTPLFEDVDSYIEYLRETVRLPGMDVELNGGAQFKRLMYEVEVFTRFAGLGHKFRREDVIQARGSALHEVNWRDVIVGLMMHKAPGVMKEKTKYVGERLRWFFMEQKDCTLQFMLAIKGSPEEHLYSSRLHHQAKVIERNETMKSCIYQTFDESCQRHQEAFMQMWSDWMNSMFQSPLKLLKAGSMPRIEDSSYESEIAPTFESTKDRIQEERRSRDKLQCSVDVQIAEIPNDDGFANEAVLAVQKIIEQTFGRIRCAVSDQMELYSKSFFLLPMLRRLEGDMAKMELLEEDKMRYRTRKQVLEQEEKRATGTLADLIWCIDSIQKFRITQGEAAG